MYKEKIGIIGGFGAYATLNFYKRILEVFASDSERNYPHIIMDNNFTMPSRTRALLYGDDYDEIVDEITNSIKMMMDQEVDKIILVCGTAHYFLKDVYKRLPESKEKIINIVEVLGEKLNEEKVKNVLVIAAEGTLKKEVYSEILKKYDVSCINPNPSFYDEIRYYIEAVKKNKIDYDTVNRFMNFIERFNMDNIVLGCTEFPILVKYISDFLQQDKEQLNKWNRFKFIDPLEIVIQKIKEDLI